jgi:hypothetical protein
VEENGGKMPKKRQKRGKIKGKCEAKIYNQMLNGGNIGKNVC